MLADAVLENPDAHSIGKTLEKAEAVRLVVWDLDETFWKGTLTEGGISEYVQEHHDIIIELAQRGIMSSVCSKNDPAKVLEILQEKGILDYIIFPSISWEPKAARLSRLIDTVQLRPTTVMFIDDNPSNRAEAAAIIPGLQVEDEMFICKMLTDRRFKGKDDSGLTRLAQYKLLEIRKRDEEQVSGSNDEFLRGCDIRVYIEHDIQTHVDRAVELINRTNQLNYTKQRLPEEPDQARKILLDQCSKSSSQAGLVEVIDKYGDYGFVGFFALRGGRSNPSHEVATQTLVHYCFSCRTLGMYVEKWLYDYLRRPELQVVGEVLTDLSENRNIDWIRMVPTLSDVGATISRVAPEIRVYGGCKSYAVAHYLGAYAGSTKVTGNFAAGRMFVRINSGALLLSACKHTGPEFEREMASFGIPFSLLGSDFFDAPAGTVFIFSGAYDAEAGQYRYRHRVHGWDVKIEVNGLPLNFVSVDEEQIRELENMNFTPEAKRQVQFVARHIRNNYESVEGVSGAALDDIMRDFLDRIPNGCKLIVLLDDDRVRTQDNKLIKAPWTTKYNDRMKMIVESCPFASAVSLGDFIQNDEEIQRGGNHYERMVYCRAADKIIEIVRKLSAKSTT